MSPPAPRPVEPPARAGVPAPPTSFVGREHELVLVRRLLADSRLLTLTGAGGSGKTRLAIRLAAEAGDEFPDGVFFVPLAPLREPELVASSIAEVLGLREASDRPPLERVAAHLRYRRVLLVLDNFEHLLPAATTVSELMTMASEVRVVVTSRSPLRVSGEQECPVPPLAEPDAVRLFQERAAAADPGFDRDGRRAAAVAQIVARLDRLPLAIELAAARTRLLPPAEILAHLDDTLGFLVGGVRDAPDRQRTLRATIAWSYDLLTPPARRLLAAWSVFRGGAELAAAEAVCGQVLEPGRSMLDAVLELGDLSLLRPVPAAGRARFSMLETIREFAAERLAELPEGPAVRAAHAAAHAVLAEAARVELWGLREREWLDRLELEHNNLRAALDHLEAAAPAQALEMAAGLTWFWSLRGHFEEGRARLAEALRLAPDATSARAAALAGAGWLAIDQGDYAAAARLAEEAVAAARTMGDGAAEGLALAFLSRANLAQFRTSEAVRLGDEAAARLRAAADPPRLALGLMYAGLATDYAGRPAEACVLFAEVLDLCRELGWRSLQARASTNLGVARVTLGELKGAREALTEGLAASFEIGDRFVVPVGLGGFAGLAARTGRPRLAMRLFGAAEAVADAGQSSIPTPVRATQERWVAPARRALGPSAARYEREGRGLGPDEAVALALANPPDETSGREPRLDLSRREREVATLVARGATNREVAERLHLSVRTVDVHVDHILTKLGFHTRAQLVAWAFEEGLIGSKNT
jgi:predicted ATPase/DNA-binding CsgD family transcriptional regulator